MSNGVQTGIRQNLIVNELVRKNNLVRKLVPFLLGNGSIKGKGAEMLSSLPTLNTLADLISPKSQTSDQLNNNVNGKGGLVHNNNLVHGVHPYTKPSPPRRSPVPAVGPMGSGSSPKQQQHQSDQRNETPSNGLDGLYDRYDRPWDVCKPLV
ncbi:hypothetical protein RUM43_009767 [Polyplax serrata]|uniref:Uncharacterized protein n=1 Tax=Polyplax serrata TaxID=468196 RepID=A0AAN8S9V2_POLSC